MSSPESAVIFYSLNGNTRRLAGLIASAARAEVIELAPVMKQPAERSLEHIWSSTTVTMTEEPVLRSMERDLAPFDLLIHWYSRLGGSSSGGTSPSLPATPGGAERSFRISGAISPEVRCSGSSGSGSPSNRIKATWRRGIDRWVREMEKQLAG